MTSKKHSTVKTVEIGEFKAKESCLCLTDVEPSTIRGGKVIDMISLNVHRITVELMLKCDWKSTSQKD